MYEAPYFFMKITNYLDDIETCNKILNIQVKITIIFDIFVVQPDFLSGLASSFKKEHFVDVFRLRKDWWNFTVSFFYV